MLAILKHLCRTKAKRTAFVIAATVTTNLHTAWAEHHAHEHAKFPSNACGMHITRGELSEALFDCNRALARNPTDIHALSNRGSANLLLGKAKEALADFDAATLLRPYEAQLHYNRGLALARLGERKSAIDAYSSSLRINPDFAAAYHNRGYEYELIGDLENAKSDYQRALQIDPRMGPSRSRLQRLDDRAKGGR